MKNKTIISLFTTILAVFITATQAYAQNENVYFLSKGSGSDYMGIIIDGNYDDWEDKPFSKIQYEWDDGNRFHTGSVFRDQEFVYLAIKMSDLSYTQFNGYNNRFTIDGVDHFVVFVPPEGVSVGDGNTPLDIRSQNGYGIIQGGEGVVTRESGKGDRWEIKIPLSFFTSETDNIRTIKFHSSNLGPQEIVSTGTSTAPIVLASIGLIIAATGLAISNKYKTRKAKSQ